MCYASRSMPAPTPTGCRRKMSWRPNSSCPATPFAKRSASSPRLSEALIDAHLDVRKAAVLSLTRWAAEPAARDALRISLKDSDANVRAYARRALEEQEG